MDEPTIKKYCKFQTWFRVRDSNLLAICFSSWQTQDEQHGHDEQHEILEQRRRDRKQS